MVIENLSIKKSILFYDEQEEVLEDHAPEFLDGLNEDEMCAIEHMNDFEDVAFCVIDYETVLVFSKSDGNVYNKYNSMDEFVDVVRNLIPDYMD